METFKAWKELIKAVKCISSAIEGEKSKGGSGEVDDTNYIISIGDERYGLINKTLDASKLAFNLEEFRTLNPTKVGDIFTQEGIDIINNMLSKEVIVTESAKVYVFLKDTEEGDFIYPFVDLGVTDTTHQYKITFGIDISGYTSDKFTLDTPMSQGGKA